MRLGILGEPNDPQVRTVAQQIIDLGHVAVAIHPGSIELKAGVAFLEGDMIIDGDSLADVEAWWIRQLPSQFLPIYGRSNAPDPGSLHEIEVQARERQQIFLSWLCELDDLGVPIVNPPRTGITFIYKPYQLARMRRAGVPVPKTLYTNSPEAARAFRREVGPCIVKPVAGGSHTRDFDDESVQNTLHLIERAPIVVQERAYGQHIRVTIVGDEIVSEVVIQSDLLDYRDDPSYHQNAAYADANLSDEAKEIARLAQKAAGFIFTGIDILRDEETHVVLECNSSPIYLDIERRKGHPISRKIAEYLIRRAEERRA